MKRVILENQLIDQLALGFRRSPYQVNRVNESDAEILSFGDGRLTLAVTTDAIVEETASGLYDDPHLIGWMAAMVNFSDLAAVGAAPLGLLIAEILPPNFPEESLRRLQRGIEDACRTCGSYVLGGDTNAGSALEVAGCAVGLVDRTSILTRKGCHAGDLLYCSGPLGSGNGFALSRFVIPGVRYPFAPAARIREGQILRDVADACMDTSDGVLATLDQLMRVNDIGFQLDHNWQVALDGNAAALASQAHLPPWLLLAGQHGEFELLFTVPPEHEEDLLGRAAAAGWSPVKIGTVISRAEISLEISGEPAVIDTARIRNAAFTAQGNVSAYIRELLNIHRELQEGRGHHG
jgi:thiamine-monophosphate kinase